MKYELKLPNNYIKPKLPTGKTWVAALRSGEYKQTEGFLHQSEDDGYCCLGVLSKLQGRLTEDNGVFYDGKEARVCETLDENNPLITHLSRFGNFPTGVFVIFDVKNIDNKYVALTECNDQGLDFNQIADIIEAVWECE